VRLYLNAEGDEEDVGMIEDDPWSKELSIDIKTYRCHIHIYQVYSSY
jgi:hypothetical protein